MESVRFPMGRFEMRVEDGQASAFLCFDASSNYTHAALGAVARHSSEDLGPLVVPAATRAGELAFGRRSSGTIPARARVEAVSAAASQDPLARLVCSAEATKALVRALAELDDAVIAPALLRYSPSGAHWCVLLLPSSGTPLHTWFGCDEAAWAWSARELLLGRRSKRPIQSYLATLHDLALGGIFGASLSGLERFQRVLSMRNSRPRAFTQLLSNLPAELAKAVESWALLAGPEQATARRLRELDRLLGELSLDAAVAALVKTGDSVRAAKLQAAVRCPC